VSSRAPVLTVLGSLLVGVALAQTVRENVAVEVVTVRLTARTTFGGKRVEDLAASDLALKVDGRPVAIETFSTVESRSEVGTAAPAERMPAATATADTDEPPLRTMIFVDEVETHPFDRKDVCAELVRYVQARGAGHREFSVVRYDGTVRMETGWTRDVETVVRALRAIENGGHIQRVEGLETLPMAPRGLSYAFASNLWVSMHRERFSVGLMEALAAFPQMPGTKRLLVVNGGASMARPGELSYVRGPSLASETAIHDRSQSPDPARLDERGDRESEGFSFELWSRVANPGLDVLSMNDVVRKALEEDVEIVPVYTKAIDRPDFDVTAAAGMIGLANETGAEAIGLGRNAAARMAEIEDRAAYELTFRDPTPDHAHHRIALKCLRPFVQIVYRRGFRIPREEELTLDTVVAGLRDPERLTNPMQVHAAQQPAADSTRRPATTLAITYAPPLETGASGERPVSLVAVGEARNGDRTEPVAWSGRAERQSGEDAFEANIRLNVSPDYAWSVAVRDQPTGLTSYVFVPAPANP